jgi:hypothetical protein
LWNQLVLVISSRLVSSGIGRTTRLSIGKFVRTSNLLVQHAWRPQAASLALALDHRYHNVLVRKEAAAPGGRGRGFWLAAASCCQGGRAGQVPLPCTTHRDRSAAGRITGGPPLPHDFHMALPDPAGDEAERARTRSLAHSSATRGTYFAQLHADAARSYICIGEYYDAFPPSLSGEQGSVQTAELARSSRTYTYYCTSSTSLRLATRDSASGFGAVFFGGMRSSSRSMQVVRPRAHAACMSTTCTHGEPPARSVFASPRRGFPNHPLTYSRCLRGSAGTSHLRTAAGRWHGQETCILWSIATIYCTT